MNAYT